MSRLGQEVAAATYDDMGLPDYLNSEEVARAMDTWELGKYSDSELQAELAARATEPDYQDLYARKDELDITEGVIYDTADGRSYE